MINKIDRETPLPLYYQLKSIIRDSITSGQLKPGDVIPTEIELMDTYGVSRATVRQAINALANEGYLRRERAKGTFVKYPPVERKFLGNLRCFSEEMQRNDIPHGTLVLDSGIIQADVLLSEKLQLNYDDRVFSLRRLRTVDDSPVLIVQSYIPYEICPGIEQVNFNIQSLYNTLEQQYNINLVHGQRVIEPKIVDSEETMQLLQISPNTCLSYVESVIYDKNNRPIEFLQADVLGKISIDLG